jgi:hypothetical protein
MYVSVACGCICVYVCMYVCMAACVWLHVCMYICLCMYVWLLVYVCMCVCMYVCVLFFAAPRAAQVYYSPPPTPAHPFVMTGEPAMVEAKSEGQKQRKGKGKTQEAREKCKKKRRVLRKTKEKGEGKEKFGWPTARAYYARLVLWRRMMEAQDKDQEKAKTKRLQEAKEKKADKKKGRVKTRDMLLVYHGRIAMLAAGGWRCLRYPGGTVAIEPGGVRVPRTTPLTIYNMNHYRGGYAT